jgi:hypothetical protein
VVPAVTVQEVVDLQGQVLPVAVVVTDLYQAEVLAEEE